MKREAGYTILAYIGSILCPVLVFLALYDFFYGIKYQENVVYLTENVVDFILFSLLMVMSFNYLKNRKKLNTFFQKIFDYKVNKSMLYAVLISSIILMLFSLAGVFYGVFTYEKGFFYNEIWAQQFLSSIISTVMCIFIIIKIREFIKNK